MWKQEEEEEEEEEGSWEAAPFLSATSRPSAGSSELAGSGRRRRGGLSGRSKYLWARSSVTRTVLSMPIPTAMVSTFLRNCMKIALQAKTSAALSRPPVRATTPKVTRGAMMGRVFPTVLPANHQEVYL